MAPPRAPGPWHMAILWGVLALPTEVLAPGLAPLCLGWRLWPPGHPLDGISEGAGVASLWSWPWPGRRPLWAACLVRSSMAVGKPGPAWALMNSHEERGWAPVLLLDAAS